MSHIKVIIQTVKFTNKYQNKILKLFNIPIFRSNEKKAIFSKDFIVQLPPQGAQASEEPSWLSTGTFSQLIVFFSCQEFF